MSTKLNELENATVGMTVGVIEVLCLQSFNYWKNMLQQGQPLSLDPAFTPFRRRSILYP